MLSIKLITLVSTMALFSDGKTVQQCNSCCPTPTPPDEDAVTCDKLGEHLSMLDDAIAEGSCDEVEGQQSNSVCNAFTKAIPPCMVLEGGAKRSECLAEKASELGDAEIVTNCKCKAFSNIKNTVGSVKNMMCVDSRESRYFGYGYGMNTIWFQYLLCKDMSFACYFFTQGWNQGDFGQYYLYDNLLDSSAGLTDNTLLALAVVGGGLGGGYRPQYAPAHGHYYPSTPAPEPETEPENEPEPEPLYRRRRSSGISETPTTTKRTMRRRASEDTTTKVPMRRRASEEDITTKAPMRRRASEEDTITKAPLRRRAIEEDITTKTSRRRRAIEEDITTKTSRRRRASEEDITTKTSRRRRASEEDTTTKTSRRRRASDEDTTTKASRRRRATSDCCNPDYEVCEIGQPLC